MPGQSTKFVVSCRLRLAVVVVVDNAIPLVLTVRGWIDDLARNESSTIVLLDAWQGSVDDKDSVIVSITNSWPWPWDDDGFRMFVEV